MNKNYNIVKKELECGKIRYLLFEDEKLIRTSEKIDILLDFISRAEKRSENPLALENLDLINFAG